MLTMFFKLFLLFTFYTVTVNGAKECYYCNSTEHQNCVDPFDSTLGNKVTCANMDYTKEPSNRSGGNNYYLKNTALGSVFGPIIQDKRSLVELQDFKCIKIRLRVNGAEESLVRSCAPVEPTIKNNCDFITQEVSKDGVKVLSCFESEKDLSNGAINLHIIPPMIAMIILAFILKF